MKSRKTHLLVIALVILSLSCNFLLPNSQSHVADVNSISQSVTRLPVLDLDAPLPSPGATQLRSLPTGGSDISTLIGDVETAEQAAMKAAVTDLRATLKPASDTLDIKSVAGISTFMNPPSTRQSTTEGVYLVGYSQPDIIQPADGGLSPASLIGLLSSMFTDIFSIPTAFPTHSFTQNETKGDATTTMSMEIGKSQDGSSHFGMGLQSEGTENGVSVKTDMSAVIDGQRCPTAEGQVSFSIKARIGSESGGTGTTQDLTTFVRAIVNDDAEITSSTFDVIQGTLQVKGGRQVYLETGETFKYGPNFEGGKESNWHVNQKTDNVTQEDVNQLEPPGLQAALELGVASLASAMHTWQNGGCVKIVAASPGTVQPGSTTAIPVNVISVFDGANAPSKLTAALTGAESIDPTSLATTPGSLSYTAPNENGKSASILLTATSKRGKAKLELSANTGGAAYRIVGGLDDWQTDTAVCDIMQPFALTSPILTLNFSGGLSGTYSYSGGPFGAAGGGRYAISLPDGIGKPGTMTGGGEGCVETPLGTFCNGGTEQYTLTPLPEGSCP
jgi:hypothetical protein